MNLAQTKTILLVEDEILIAMTQKISLQQYGYNVINVNSGEKAIETINSNDEIELILMDIDLGRGLDGTQAAQVILIDHEIPIIFVSSHSEREVVEKTEKITSYGYVVKSSSITVLDASIKMAFKLFEANQVLRLTKETLEGTLRALPDVIFEVGIDGRYFNCHAPDAKLLYLPIADIMGKTVSEILPANVADTVMSAIREANEEGHSIGKQFELAVPIGIRSFEIRVTRKKTATEPRFIILRRDITESKRLEERDRERRKLLEDILSSMSEWVWETDANGVYTYCSEKCLEILGYPADEILGKTPFAFMEPEEATRVKTIFAGMMDRKEKLVDLENWNIRSDGERICILTNGIPILDGKGELKGYRGIDRDVTQRKRIEAVLLSSESRLARAEKVARIGNWELNLDSMTMVSSQGARDIYGVDKDSMSLADVQRIPLSEYRSKLNEALSGLITRNEPYDIEFRIRRPKDGKNVDIHSVAEYDRKRNTVFGVLMDITK